MLSKSILDKLGKRKILFSKKTRYNQITVFEESGKVKMTLDETGNLHSLYIKGISTTGSYWDICACCVFAHPNPRTAVILGLGGGTIARILHEFTDVKIFGVEIDIWTVKAGKTFMALPNSVMCIIDSYESFLRWKRKKFDFLVFDVFSQAQTPSEILSPSYPILLSNTADVVCINTVSEELSKSILELMLSSFRWGTIIKNKDSSNWIVLLSNLDPYFFPKLKPIPNIKDMQNLEYALGTIRSALENCTVAR